ncbi:hypothetical protein SB6411_01851 [Klebsiella spallanzanii]|uniref:O-antigen and lipid-linked capsular repeat unit polymerase n=1 Tax=Klebsiella spallanzanii TaxID=2587528 RepID=A0ABY6VFL6_9ENTR|nr:hypothetical protein [Klebsiella spallanzanii]VUS60269.1 hypothetical protein SB6411_01851 [Klebsiella spallanzanii]
MLQNIDKNGCERFTYYSLLILGLLGAIHVAPILPLSETAILEIIFLFASLMALVSRGINKTALIISFLCLLYLIYSWCYASLFTNTNIFDLVLAYKSYYYMLLIGFFYKKNIFSESTIESLFKLLLILFLFKYTTDRFLLDIDRPQLLVENNYELILLILLYYYVNLKDKKIVVINTVLIAYLCFISGSRSSLIAMVITFFFSIEKKVTFKTMLIYIISPVMVFAVLILFQERISGLDGIEQIDRVKFFNEFLYSTSNWQWWEFFTGSKALTPLLPESCAALSYYQTLFSFAGDGRCYSVILHSFVIRVIYDHGFIGFSFLILCLFMYLNKCSFKERMAILLVLIATGLSVSSLNNVYVSLALIFFVGAKTNRNKYD